MIPSVRFQGSFTFEGKRLPRATVQDPQPAAIYVAQAEGYPEYTTPDSLFRNAARKAKGDVTFKCEPRDDGAVASYLARHGIPFRYDPSPDKSAYPQQS